MRKILAVMLVAVSLGGCAQLQAVSGGLSLITKSVTNPVTENELYQIEASLTILMKGLVAYRRACLAGNADKNCRANILAIQPYTKEVPVYLTQLRRFVRENDQINAANTYNTLVALYGNAKDTALRLGVNLGG
jgi:hypothetical protein